ncbi:glycosyltransferase family 2 protein [Terasakiella pusilla]|uniref:glycosyltransferase family 2 protein n=1 Tax=Terasakiella pusilla TaxID=64973 RepID=UPI003AA9C179
MKLVVQIPCYNEAATLADVIKDIPRKIVGVDCIEILVIDDGSRDESYNIAKECQVDHIIRHPVNNGLADAFRSGLDRCRELDADIVVNIDADNQYDAKEIPMLVQPILKQHCDVVVGNRDPSNLAHFSFAKRVMQKLGSRVVSILSKIDIPDATSGFRAYSKDALFKLTIETDFSHSLETLVQARWKGLRVISLPIRARHTERASRLASSNREFVFKSIATLVRVVTFYRPLSFYWSLGAFMGLLGTAPMMRFLWFFFNGDGRGHIQSLVIGGTFVIIGTSCLLFGVLANQINSNRRLLEETNERLRRMDYQNR